MTNHPTKKLGEVIELKYGRGISQNDRKPDGKYPVYGANGILDHTDKYLVEGVAIIVGRKGSAGEITKVSGKFWSSDVTYYVLANDKIDIDYLFYFFQNINLKQFASGVKPGINRNQVYNLEIPLPSLETQKKIVAKLDVLLGKIKEAKKLRAEAQESTNNLLSAELNKIFTEGKAKGWEEKELGKVTEVVGGGTPSTLVSNYWNGDVVWVTPKDLGRLNSDTVTSSLKGITQKGLEKSSAKLLPKGSVVLSSRAPIGYVAIAGTPLATNQGCRSFVCKENLYNRFLYYFLIYSRELLKAGGSGSTFSEISGSKLKKIKILLPPLSEQKKIVAHLDSLSENINKIQEDQTQTADDLTTLEQSILHKAFQGELV